MDSREGLHNGNDSREDCRKKMLYRKGSTGNAWDKILRSCFRQAVKWDMMEKTPAVDATVPKAKKQEREIWTAEMLMQALEAYDNKMLKIAFHLAFTVALRIGKLLGLTWDDMDISEEAIADKKAYVICNKHLRMQ